MMVDPKESESTEGTKPIEKWTIKEFVGKLTLPQLYRLIGFVIGSILLIFGLGLKAGDWLRSHREPEIEQVQEMPAEYGFLYSEFVKDGGTIILSNPPVYKYLNKAEQNALLAYFQKQSISEIPQQSLMVLNLLDIGYEKKVGDATFRHIIESRDEYTGIGEALGLVRIKEFFIKHRISPIKITQSNFGYPEENVILLGGWISQRYSQMFIDEIAKYLRYWNIPYRTYDGAIYIDGMKAYEPTRNSQITSFEIQEDYAIIAKIPNPLNLSKAVIICAGINSQGTEAASRAISEDKEIDRLKTEIEKQLGSIPEWFQVIIKVPVVDGRPLRDWKFVTSTPVLRRK